MSFNNMSYSKPIYLNRGIYKSSCINQTNGVTGPTGPTGSGGGGGGGTNSITVGTYSNITTILPIERQHCANAKPAGPPPIITIS